MKEILHNMASLWMGETVDRFSIHYHSDTDSSAYSYIDQRLFNLMFTQFELGHCCSIDVCIYSDRDCWKDLR
jgi:hypothetical protein